MSEEHNEQDHDKKAKEEMYKNETIYLPGLPNGITIIFALAISFSISQGNDRLEDTFIWTVLQFLVYYFVGWKGGF